MTDYHLCFRRDRDIAPYLKNNQPNCAKWRSWCATVTLLALFFIVFKKG